MQTVGIIGGAGFIGSYVTQKFLTEGYTVKVYLSEPLPSWWLVFFRLGRSRDHLISLLGEFAQKGIHFKALDLGVDSSTTAGKLVLQIFAALAEYDRESIPEKTGARQLPAKANGKHIGRLAGSDVDKFAKVKKAPERGLWAAETVSLTGISMSSLKHYRKQIEKTIDQSVISK